MPQRSEPVTRGASLGIDAIKIAALDFMSNFFIHFPTEKIQAENHLLFEPIASPYAKPIKGICSIKKDANKFSACSSRKCSLFAM